MPGVSGSKPLSTPVANPVALVETDTEAEAEPETIEPVHDTVALGEAKNLAEANTEPETTDEPEMVDEPETEEPVEEFEPETVEPVETVAEPETVEPIDEPEAVEPIEPQSEVTEMSEPVAEPETAAEPETVEPVEPQPKVSEEYATSKDDESARFKAATAGFDRLEKFTFKIFKDVFDNVAGVNVTARQTLADLLLFIAAKCKNAGKIEDFKRAFNINKDFDRLNQSAANYIPVLLSLTLKLKAQSDFARGVFNEIRGILLNIICDETAVEFELKILKQLLF